MLAKNYDGNRRDTKRDNEISNAESNVTWSTDDKSECGRNNVVCHKRKRCRYQQYDNCDFCIQAKRQANEACKPLATPELEAKWKHVANYGRACRHNANIRDTGKQYGSYEERRNCLDNIKGSHKNAGPQTKVKGNITGAGIAVAEFLNVFIM